ncbi:MAG: type II toxin-antitoxin system RelE/ParE family toxin [Thermoguttaceae bacterium]|jgi:plasmid stabilization system protein ParE
MPAKLLILPAAERDTDEAFGWYERRQKGLGFEFLRAVDARVRAIQRNPEMCAVIEQHYRRALVRRFPYAILYAHTEDTVTIYAVFHTSRDPKKLRARLPDEGNG